jgi:hypothetical protein
MKGLPIPDPLPPRLPVLLGNTLRVGLIPAGLRRLKELLGLKPGLMPRQIPPIALIVAIVVLVAWGLPCWGLSWSLGLLWRCLDAPSSPLGLIHQELNLRLIARILLPQPFILPEGARHKGPIRPLLRLIPGESSVTVGFVVVWRRLAWPRLRRRRACVGLFLWYGNSGFCWRRWLNGLAPRGDLHRHMAPRCGVIRH